MSRVNWPPKWYVWAFGTTHHADVGAAPASQASPRTKTRARRTGDRPGRVRLGVDIGDPIVKDEPHPGHRSFVRTHGNRRTGDAPGGRGRRSSRGSAGGGRRRWTVRRRGMVGCPCRVGYRRRSSQRGRRTMLSASEPSRIHDHASDLSARSVQPAASGRPPRHDRAPRRGPRRARWTGAYAVDPDPDGRRTPDHPDHVGERPRPLSPRTDVRRGAARSQRQALAVVPSLPITER